jgi:hypothetical protein
MTLIPKVLNPGLPNIQAGFSNQSETDKAVAALRNAGLPDNPPLLLPDKPSIAVLTLPAAHVCCYERVLVSRVPLSQDVLHISLILYRPFFGRQFVDIVDCKIECLDNNKVIASSDVSHFLLQEIAASATTVRSMKVPAAVMTVTDRPRAQ